MLKSNQNKVFWHLEDLNQIQQIAIFQDRRRPQGNTNKKGNNYFPKKAARRATQTKKGNSEFSQKQYDKNIRKKLKLPCIIRGPLRDY